MNKKEARETIIKNTENFFLQRGFSLVKSMKQSVQYKKSNSNVSCDNIYISILGNVILRIELMVHKRIFIIEELIEKISKAHILNPMPDKLHSSFIINSEKINNINGKTKFDDTGIEFVSITDAIALVKLYVDEIGIPMLNRYEDIREIDKEINGVNFWERDDFQKPFYLGGNFAVKRLIIAKLSGRKDYEQFIEHLFNKIETNYTKNGIVYDRNDLNNIIAYTVNFLKIVEPLY